MSHLLRRIDDTSTPATLFQIFSHAWRTKRRLMSSWWTVDLCVSHRDEHVLLRTRDVCEKIWREGKVAGIWREIDEYTWQ
jgi:hypothetical protein